MVRVASLILSLRNGTKDESANNLEHQGAHADTEMYRYIVSDSSVSCEEYSESIFRFLHLPGQYIKK